jgi:pilus assembly protein CpaB
MGRRTVLLIAALLVATLATSLVYLYVRSVDDRARAGERQVEVLVATGQIPAGTTGDQASANGWFDLKTVAQSSVADGAVSSIEPIQNLVAQSMIFPGEQILQQKFGPAGTATTLPLEPGQIAMSVQLSDPARVAGFVDAGTDVAIFLTSPGRPNSSGVAQPFTRTLLDRVPVLAKGQATVVNRTTQDANNQQQQEQIPAAILTLGVTQEQAQKIIFAQSQGELYFGLLNDDSEVDPRRPGTTDDNLFES